MSTVSKTERDADAEFCAQVESVKLSASPGLACPHCQSMNVTCLEAPSTFQHPFGTALVDCRCECGFGFTIAYHGDGSPPQIWQDDISQVAGWANSVGEADR